MEILKRKLYLLALIFFSNISFTSSIGFASNSSAEIISEYSLIADSEEFLIGVKYKLDKGWHTYWKNPGDSGDKASFEWNLPEGVTISEPYWPQPELIPYPPLMTYGYNDEVIVIFKVRSSELVKDKSDINLLTKWLACSDVCLPQGANLKLSLPHGPSSLPSDYYSVINNIYDEEIPKLYQQEVSSIISDDSLIISFPITNDNKDKKVIFFPDEDGLVDYSAKQISEINNESISLIIKRADIIKNFSNISGLLQFKGDFANQSYSFNSFISNQTSTNDISILVALIFAVIGGFILNLMPCVFPVISLKILNFIEISDNKKEIRLHGLAFCAGTILTFLLIGLLILGLRSSGEEIGWGFQLQSPIFVSILIYLFIFMSALFLLSTSFGSFFTRAGNLLSSNDGYSGSFGTGFLAVIVATPCTAPFMGSALGIALLQPSFYSILIFFSLGLGFSIPYLILSFFPALISKFPAPGAWMETFKKSMSVPMFLTAIWLLWILSNQISIQDLYEILFASLIIFIIVFINSFENFFKRKKTLNNFFIVASISICFYLLPANEPKANIKAFSADYLQNEIEKGPVFLNFTADWCITCKVNEQVALKDKNFTKIIESRNIKYIKADWTNKNSEISRLLESFGRSGIPLYVYFPQKDSKPIILPEILNDKIISNFLDKDY